MGALKLGAKCTDEEFVQLFTSIGPHATARKLGTAVHGVFARRKRMEGRLGRQITPPDHPRNTRHNIVHPGRIECELRNGTILIGSDAHIWPGPASTSLRAFKKFCSDLSPDFVVMNGDVLDFATISRWPGNWEDRPTVQQEIEAAQDQLHEIASAVPRKCRQIWTLGNHDARLEAKIAGTLPELVKLKGVHLKDWFPGWEPCWAVWINDIVIKHRWKAGVHATYNNLRGGKHMVTGHLHSLQVRPFTNYAGTLYGVDSGCMINPFSPQFLYAEDNPRDWRQGFVVLTIRDGRLMMPELVSVWDENNVEFRGNIISV
jgi:hypothetical protein